MWNWVLRVLGIVGVPMLERHGPRLWQALVARVKGDTWWIVGPMDAGKSTLVATLAGRVVPIGQSSPTQGQRAVDGGHNPELETWVREGRDLGGDPQFWSLWREALTAQVERMVFVCDPGAASPRPVRADERTRAIVEAFEAACAAIDAAYGEEKKPKARELLVYFNKADLWLDAGPEVDREPEVVAGLRKTLADRFAPVAEKHGLGLRFGWGSLVAGEGWARHRRHVFGG
ncbi:MAG: hypothetical protein R3F65_17750 [bacterium]